ncbi:unnamed protein product [Choristocarpus tenellus]
MKDQLLQKLFYQSDNESSGDEDDDGLMGGGSTLGAVRKGEASSVISIPPPSYSQVADEFASLETTVEECSMDDVSYHFRKAKLAWLSVIGARAIKQADIRNFLAVVIFISVNKLFYSVRVMVDAWRCSYI